MTELLTPAPESIKERVLTQFEQANEKRDYSVYTRLMDAALEAKARSIFPHFKHIPNGALIVDAGSGTGALAELAALEFNRARVVALDTSHELLERASTNQALTHLVYGDATKQNFPDDSVTVKYYSTSGHEIASFLGKEAMQEAVRVSFKENIPGGQLIIRDFAKPATNRTIYMQILSTGGIENVADATTDGVLDYDLLSTKALFKRFHEEFAGGNAFSYEEVKIDGKEYLSLPEEWAHEFYLRKDYTTNWRQEINEKYTYWTPEEAEKILTAEGYINVRAVDDPNDFILTNRLIGKIALFEKNEDGIQPIPFPPTHMVVVGEKPMSNHQQGQSVFDRLHNIVDYPALKESISFDTENEQVIIGGQVFSIDMSKKIQTGSKKNVYWLKGEENRVLKVIRNDTFNDHAIFKAMYQSIIREQILNEEDVPHARILEVDPDGPPYRYFIQEAAPDDAPSAAELMETNSLTEEDVKQMAEIVNTFESGKKYQLDTNPFNWYRITNADGSTQMYYIDGKIYPYDEAWEFRRIGLLQWIDPFYVTDLPTSTARIPKAKEYEQLQTVWDQITDEKASWWKKYLHPNLQPK